MFDFDFLKPKLPPSGYHLKYLFIAELFNGQTINQTPDDKPRFAKSGSSFTDVVAVLDQVKRFSLVSREPVSRVETYEGLAPFIKQGERAVITVDLVDGHCEVNGHRIFAPAMVPPGVRFKLIYYRQVGRRIEVGLDGKVIPPLVKYVMGWEYIAGGKNHKWEIILK